MRVGESGDMQRRVGPSCVTLSFAFLCLYLATAGGSLGSSDAVVTYEVTRSLVEHGSVALPADLLGAPLNRGTDGRYYSQFGLGQSLYNVPFFVAGQSAQRMLGRSLGKEDSVSKAAVALGNTVAAAAVVGLTCLLGYLMSSNLTAAIVVATACGLASPLWVYARLGFNAPLAALLLVTSTTLLHAGTMRRRAMWLRWAGVVTGLGCMTRHEFVLVVIFFSGWLVVAPDQAALSRVPLVWRRWGNFLPGALAGVGVTLAYNLARFGHATQFGYTPAFGLAGLAGLLISPAASVFLYCPVVVAGLYALRRAPNRQTAWLLAGPALVLFLFYGLLEDWPGGRSYGPRYLVPLLPMLLTPIVWLVAHGAPRVRRLVVTLAALSALVQLPGVLVDYGRASQAWSREVGPVVVAERLSRWSAAPLAIAARAVLNPTSRLPAGSGQAGTTDVWQTVPPIPDVWWLHGADLGGWSRSVGWTIGATLIAAAMFFGWRAWALAGEPSGAPIATDPSPS